MEQRVRISDIAEELGLSTATVSNVIHGKTRKISDETVQRAQFALEQRQYIPSIARNILAQNSSKIIGVVVDEHADDLRGVMSQKNSRHTGNILKLLQ